MVSKIILWVPAPQSVAKHGGRADVGSTLYTLNDATRKEAIRPMMAVLDFAQPITYTLSLNVRATSQVESHWDGLQVNELLWVRRIRPWVGFSECSIVLNSA